MASTPIIGLTGSITLPGLSSQEVSQITIASGAELLDVSAYGGTGYRIRVPGIKDLSGTAVAFLSKGASGANPFGAPGTSGSLSIVFDTGCTVTFNAVIGQVSIVGQYAGLNIVSFQWSYDSDQAPVVAWVNS